MSIFSVRLSEIMNQQHISQKDLAQKVQVTESAMSYYVKGDRTPRSDVLSRIASALGVTTDYLLGTDNNQTNNGDDKLQYLQRNLGKLDEEQLKKAESVLKAVFDDIFDDDDEE